MTVLTSRTNFRLIKTPCRGRIVPKQFRLSFWYAGTDINFVNCDRTLAHPDIIRPEQNGLPGPNAKQRESDRTRIYYLDIPKMNIREDLTFNGTLVSKNRRLSLVGFPLHSDECNAENCGEHTADCRDQTGYFNKIHAVAPQACVNEWGGWGSTRLGGILPESEQKCQRGAI